MTSVSFWAALALGESHLEDEFPVVPGHVPIELGAGVRVGGHVCVNGTFTGRFVDGCSCLEGLRSRLLVGQFGGLLGLARRSICGFLGFAKCTIGSFQCAPLGAFGGLLRSFVSCNSCRVAHAAQSPCGNPGLFGLLQGYERSVFCRLVPGTHVQCVDACLVAGLFHCLSVAPSVLGRLLASFLGTPIGFLRELYGLAIRLDGSITSLHPYGFRRTDRAPVALGGSLDGLVPNVQCGSAFRYRSGLAELRAKYAKQLMASLD